MTAVDARRGERRAVVLVLIALVSLAIYRGSLNSDDLYLFGAAIPSIILHEVSHGAVAYLFGDDTARRAGRLTLNPIAHIDLFGTLLMPAMLAFAGVPAFGYAKPVPVNVSRLRSPRNQSVLVSLAGPATNIVIAAIAALLFKLSDPHGGVAMAIYAVGAVNVLLATFNMLPIPPLDGSALIERMLPRAWWPGYLTIRRYSIFLVLFVVFTQPRLIQNAYEPLVRVWERAAGLIV